MLARGSTTLALVLLTALVGVAPAHGAPEARGVLAGAVRLDDGTPLEGVRVRVWDARDGSVAVSAPTDPDGSFSVSVPPSKYVVVLEAEFDAAVGWHRTFAPGTTRPTDAAVYPVRPAGRVDVELSVTRAAVITGRVVDEAGSPVAGAEVVASAGLTGRASSVGVTDVRGRYRVLSPGSGRTTDISVTRGARAGERTVVTEADGSATVARITVRKKGRARVVVDLGSRVGRSVLRLYDDGGAEVGSVGVTSSKRTPVTFDALLPGRYWAVLDGTGRAVKVRVRAGRTAKVGPVRLTKGESSHLDKSLGTIRRPNGKPVPGARVEICAARAACASTFAGSDGRYRFSTPAPGTYRAVITSGQNGNEFGQRRARVTTLRIDSRRGQHYPDITLQRTRKVTLVLTDRVGAPVRGVNAWLGDRRTSGTDQESNREGRVVWQGVPAARYRIGILDENPDGYCDSSRTVKRSGEDVTVRMVLDRCDGSSRG